MYIQIIYDLYKNKGDFLSNSSLKIVLFEIGHHRTITNVFILMSHRCDYDQSEDLQQQRQHATVIYNDESHSLDYVSKVLLKAINSSFNSKAVAKQHAETINKQVFYWYCVSIF